MIEVRATLNSIVWRQLYFPEFITRYVSTKKTVDLISSDFVQTTTYVFFINWAGSDGLAYTNTVEWTSFPIVDFKLVVFINVYICVSYGFMINHS